MISLPKTGFLADLFAAPGNSGWDLGRIMGFLAFLPMVAAVVHNIHRGDSIDLMALGSGIGAIYLGIVALIAGKDFARTNALSQVTQDATAATSQAKQDETAAEAPAAAASTVTVTVKPPAAEEDAL